jgi:hypothetical protein
MSAFYRATLTDFLSHSSQQVIGCLTAAFQHSELQKRQIKAWEAEIAVLKESCVRLLKAKPITKKWSLILEYPIPRRRKRLDAVLLARDVILCVEFKTRDRSHSLAADRQVEEYALDLRDFHEMSRNRRVVPIVVVPKAPLVLASPTETIVDDVRPVVRANADNLAEQIQLAFESEHRSQAPPIAPKAWDNSPYHPVPTIIEAAEALYAGHNVAEIAHSHAGAVNLTRTSECLIAAIQRAQSNKEKIACFVTGVPGAGKTLAGLNVVHNPVLRRQDRPAGIFLSGNRPLVNVVSAAISRDQRTVSTFIQNVHIFVREGMEKRKKPPVERVIVFDEAQRAWNADQNENKNAIEISEPETILQIMDRHQDWAVLIALVGGGQEIHTGEAGLEEWGTTLREKFSHWKVCVSPEAIDGDPSLAGHGLFEDGNAGSLKIIKDSALHLKVNLRSFRAQRLTEWVEAVLELKPTKAATIMRKLHRFPLALTRSLSTAREWLNRYTRGERRCGLIASSGALRLRADGIELSSGFRQGNRDMYVRWFLTLPPDVRSSNQLEVAASEFECQGLELDWTSVCWGADLRLGSTSRQWLFRRFSGTTWENVRTQITRRYLLNKYRVLLTRARQGMIIWVPEGRQRDKTHSPEFFDSTAAYLRECGLQLI